jgi:hypothetical protein
MLTHIIKNEWRNLRADRTLWLVAALFAVSAILRGGQRLRVDEFSTTNARRSSRDEASRYDALKKQIIEYDLNAPGKIEPIFRPARSGGAGRNIGQRYTMLRPRRSPPYPSDKATFCRIISKLTRAASRLLRATTKLRIRPTCSPDAWTFHSSSFT